jgi:hypothetical protein
MRTSGEGEGEDSPRGRRTTAIEEDGDEVGEPMAPERWNASAARRESVANEPMVNGCAT